MLNTPRGRRTVTRQCLVAVAMAIAAGAACDKVPLMAPTESAITLFANATSVGLNGTVDVTATVIESSGTPVQNGTVVTFFTTIGTIDPAEARTQNGKATVRLRAGGVSGSAIVRASSGGNVTKDPQLTIAVGGASAGRVEVFANPTALPSGGGTVQLSAVVYDTGGNRLAGAPVSFAADNGSVSPNTATTDGNGEARSVLTTTIASKVTVTVANGTAAGLTSTVDIKLRSAPEVSIAVDTTTPTAGQPVSFTFTIKAGASAAAVRTAVADFGDGESQSLGTSGSTKVTHVYVRDGTYTVTASATDTAGETTVVTTSVVVRGQLPVTVTLAVSAAPTVGSVTTFSATATGASGTTISRFEWDFGQGDTRTTTGSSTTFVYRTAGRYVVTVRAVASDGATGSAKIDVIVEGFVVSLTASPPSPAAGSVVTFTAVVSPASVAILRYEWDFGQGTVRTTSGPSTTFVYGAGGRYVVSVRAVASDEAAGSARIDIIVVGLSVTLTALPASPSVGTPVTFTATVSPGGTAIVRYDWTLGDGTTRTTTSNTTTHTYTTAGSKTVQVVVVPYSGAAVTGRMVLEVQ